MNEDYNIVDYVAKNIEDNIIKEGLLFMCRAIMQKCKTFNEDNIKEALKMLTYLSKIYGSLYSVNSKNYDYSIDLRLKNNVLIIEFTNTNNPSQKLLVKSILQK